MEKKRNRILVNLLMIIVGFILNSLAWTILPGPNLNTFGLIVGLSLLFVGLIYLIINITNDN